MSDRIPLSTPHIARSDWKNVRECFETGWVSTAGAFVDRFEKDVAGMVGGRFAIACNSGTSALHVSLLLAGVGRDDEVIVPTVTFIAPINTVHYTGAHPVFMDCDEFYNIDVEKVREFLLRETSVRKGVTYNKKTRRRIAAIIPVHIFGNAVDMEELVPLCRSRKIRIVEDATESLGTVYNKEAGRFSGKWTGTLGDFGCYSFNGNKIITAGGGGMIIAKNAGDARSARYLTTQAKDDGQLYIHNEVGFNYRLNNLQAALGVSQLERLHSIIKLKRRNYELYQRALEGVEGLQLGKTPLYAESNCWMYALQIDERRYGRSRDEVMRKFCEEGVEVRPLWGLNHLQRPYRKCQHYRIERAQPLYQSTLNLPCSYDLRKLDILKVTGLLQKWKK